MKILFASYYHYFQKDLYTLIIKEMKNGCFEIRFLPTHSTYGRKECLENADKIVLLGQTPERTKTIKGFSFIKELTIYLYDRYTLKKLFTKWRPDVVVINNDLAGVYIKMLQDVCANLDIPVIVLITTNFVTFPPEFSVRQGGLYTIRNNLLKFLKCYRAYLFAGTTIGTYLDNSIIAVQGEKIKNILIEKGISPSRIVITGNPLYDRYFALQNLPRIKAREAHGILSDNNSKILVYCTEKIECIYGDDYLDEINSILKGLFDSLNNDIKVIVKLHPAETEAQKKRFRQQFEGDRYIVVENVDLGNLFRSASLVIAHFSAIIMESIAVGTPVLMIDLNCDSMRHVYIPYHELVVAQTGEQLYFKTRKLLDDEQYIQNAMQILTKWVLSYIDCSDLKSTKRVVDLINKIASGQYRVRGKIKGMDFGH